MATNGAPGRPATGGHSIRMVEDVLGCKWTVQLLAGIATGHRRPGRLRRAVAGISAKVLNQRLAALTSYGVLERRLLSPRPLHVEYHLTPKGLQLARLIDEVLRFCTRWDESGDALPGSAAAPAARQARRPTPARAAPPRRRLRR